MTKVDDDTVILNVHSAMADLDASKVATAFDEFEYKNLLELLFADGKILLEHQIASMDHFMDVVVPQTILSSCPIRVIGTPDRSLQGTTRAAAGTAGTAIRVSIDEDKIDAEKKVTPDEIREVEVCVEFTNINIRKPTVFEDNGAVTPMFPQDARLRNLTYSAYVYTDILATFTLKAPGEAPVVRRRTIPHVHVGRIPVMVGSKYCIFKDIPEKTPSEMGECSKDRGGYFIIQGGERAIICQERMAENKPFVFRNNKVRGKEVEVIEVKSIGPDNEGAPKSMAVKIMKSSKLAIHPENIIVTCPRIKTNIPLFIMFRALGVLSDGEICQRICGSSINEYSKIMKECIQEASGVLTQEAAHAWLAANLGSGGGSHESYTLNTVQTERPPRTTTVRNVLAEEFLPHIGGIETLVEKASYLAFMTLKVLDVFTGRIPHDDRDGYPNKKVELSGNLMGNLFRYLFSTKVVKDIKSMISKEIHNGMWRTSGNFEEILNSSNIYKILKSTHVTIGMKSCMATGNFVGGKMGTKSGISQVLSRHNYLSSISHLRRISTPIEKTGKLIAPRKLHATSFAYICPCETPEGHQVGVVKNLSVSAQITLPFSPTTIVNYLYDELGMRNVGDVTMTEFHEGIRVFMNGAWIGVLAVDAETAFRNVAQVRAAKRCGRIHIYTGITYSPSRRELWFNTEGGRLMRPMINAPALREIAANLPTWLRAGNDFKTMNWSDVVRWKTPTGKSFIEFVDPAESENAFIAMYPSELTDEHTHVEIHPCLMLGTMGSNIPLPEHNQAPRNAYQCLALFETVRMADGSEKKIADVCIGDVVQIFDPKTYKLGTSRVINQYIRDTTRPIFQVHAGGNRMLTATDNHPLMTQRGFVAVRDLQPRADYLAVVAEPSTEYPTTGDAQFVPILAITPAANQQIADITVASQHHTFVTTGGIFSHNSSMGKQAMGVFADNANVRMDTMSNMLWYMSKPLVTTFMSKFFHSQTMPTGMNVIVAVMTYGGYNQEDSVMINRGFLDRGGFSSEFYRTYKDEEKKNQASGEEERFCRPNPVTTRHMKTANYDKLGPDGIVPVNTFVTDTDVLIGKVAPIRLRGADGASQAGIDPATLQSMSAMDAALAVEAAGGKRFRDNSKMLRANEKGFVDQIYRGRNSEGYSFVKIRTREARRPEIGDKFASRHGQKGTCGMILEPEDMPQTASGIVPDIIINPHCLVSRMTVAHILESLLGRLGCELASLCDGTPFNPHMTRERISELLLAHGVEPGSNEIMYCGYTGKQIATRVFMTPIYYQRLKHMVADKIHSRSTGPLVMLTRQPAEGRARDGGLRLGEMERDVLAAHGTSSLLKERMMEASDNFQVHICNGCGLIGIVNPFTNLWRCKACGNTTDFSQVRIPYACKLFLQELESMNISSRLLTESRLRTIADVQQKCKASDCS